MDEKNNLYDQNNFDEDDVFSQYRITEKREEKKDIEIPKQSTKDNILGLLFLIWFFASFVSLFIFSQYVAMIIGQYFLVFGIIALRDKEKIMGLIFSIVGALCIIIPFLQMRPDLIPVEIIWESVISILGVSAFLIVGICLIYIPNRKRKKLKQICNYPISATIVRYKKMLGDNNYVYCPIYCFTYNSNYYEVSNETYSNIGVKEEGSIVTLMINPQNPQEFIDDVSNIFTLFPTILGILFIITSLPIFIYLLSILTFIK